MVDFVRRAQAAVSGATAIAGMRPRGLGARATVFRRGPRLSGRRRGLFLIGAVVLIAALAGVVVVSLNPADPTPTAALAAPR